MQASTQTSSAASAGDQPEANSEILESPGSGPAADSNPDEGSRPAQPSVGSASAKNRASTRSKTSSRSRGGDTHGAVERVKPVDAAEPVASPPKVDVAEPESSPPEIDLADPSLYLNRELTWLEFNRRVLNEAEDERTPLLERVKFLAIVSSNLDEFFMKRIGGLKQQVGAGVQELTVDGRTPQQQIDEAQEVVSKIEVRKERILAEVLSRLAEHGVEVLDHADLNEEECRGLRNYYVENIMPLVTPQAIDPAHPFPFISNLSLNLLVTLNHKEEEASATARVKVPIGAGIPRFLRVGTSDRFVPLEQVISSNLDLLFPRMNIESCEPFYVTRNANLARESDVADDLLAIIESEVRERRFAPIVRVKVEKDMDPYRRGWLAAELGLDPEKDVFESGSMLAMRHLFELATPRVSFPARFSFPSGRQRRSRRRAQHFLRDPERRLDSPSASLRVVLELGGTFRRGGERRSQGTRDQDDAVSDLR